MKRISYLTHWYLGLCLGMVPVATGVAIGNVSIPAITVGFALMLWTAGFDILYALQDLKIDCTQNLHSLPAKVGPMKSIFISKICFCSMLVFLIATGRYGNLGVIYYIGLVFIACLLAYEHRLVNEAIEDGKSYKINIAFFTVNSWIGVVFLAFVALDMFVKFPTK